MQVGERKFWVLSSTRRHNGYRATPLGFNFTTIQSEEYGLHLRGQAREKNDLDKKLARNEPK